MEFNQLGKIAFWVLAISVFFYEIYQILMGSSSKGWKRLSAIVVDVSIKSREDEGTEENKPDIKYQYSYLGTLYNGNKVKFGDLWSTRYGKASNMVRGVVNGSEITIYVNPKNPKQSVLYRGYEGNILWVFVFFIVFFFIAFKS